MNTKNSSRLSMDSRTSSLSSSELSFDERLEEIIEFDMISNDNADKKLKRKYKKYIINFKNKYSGTVDNIELKSESELGFHYESEEEYF